MRADGGADTLTGGIGADMFIYRNVADSTVALSGQDTIKDFSRSQLDKIDLSLIDARTSTTADNAFTFKGTTAFTGAEGDLYYKVDGGNTFIYGDVDGNKSADIVIKMAGVYTLLATDFML